MAKFIKPNGNVQAWNSVIKTSALDYDLLEETTFFYPKAVLPPGPLTYKPYTVDIMPSNVVLPLIAKITAPMQCTNTTSIIRLNNFYNLFNNKFNDAYYETEIDLKQINPTITTLEQFLHAYSSIQFNNLNLNNLQVECAQPNIENFIPDRNINLLGGVYNCEERNFKTLNELSLRSIGRSQNDKVNFMEGSLIYDLANIKENKKNNIIYRWN
ncbi:P123 [Spiroplasma kunkelii CR2-3x]|uniref:p123 n=1 Tax=Spiroplasma kunkelii CR2-3x TaxID=273035 RepID=A0A0K2JIP8_SPIKU|nr:hypothetical protein [Spiroplasma kunkelii]ALA98111.1 P123 [Spiroplasma kunkelii CR2-3x]